MDLPAGRAPTPGSLALEVSARMDAMLRLLLREVEQEESRGALSVLGSLRTIGPSRITDLARRERVAQPSMTMLVARLEAAGLVARRADERDRRVSVISITGAGRALLGRAQAARAELLHERIAALSPAEADTLAAVLPIFDRLFAPVTAISP